MCITFPIIIIAYARAFFKAANQGEAINLSPIIAVLIVFNSNIGRILIVAFNSDMVFVVKEGVSFLQSLL